MPEENTGKFVDYYRLLNVEPAETLAAIRSRYIVLAKQSHPDKGGSTEMMQLLNRAYRTLTNNTSRAAYDLLHSFYTGRSEKNYQYAAAPKENGSLGNDDYIDMFLDQVYREFSEPAKKRKRTIRSWLSGL